MDPHCVAIVIPVHRDRLDELEELSLARCVEVLGHHRLMFVGPESLDLEAYLSRAGGAASVSVERFPDRYFTYVGHNRLMLSRDFYSRFREFTYILKYELDAFVFRDDLAHWCQQGFDYVGAPWWDESQGRWFGVGNSGFSLRSVRGCLAVLGSSRTEDPAAYWDHIKRSLPNLRGRALRYPWKIACHLGLGHTSKSYLRRFTARMDSGLGEDRFWGTHASRFCPGFRVAPIEEAFQFSVEAEPVRAWREGRCGSRPPFGCHRRWYLRWIHRYLHGHEPAESESEALVWGWAAMAGMRRIGAGAPCRG